MIELNNLSRAEMKVKMASLRHAFKEMHADMDDLDVLVDACASELATECNNAGIPAQMEFLLKNGWSPEDVIGRLKIEQQKRQEQQG